ncbi:PDDEXK-like protein of unknown function [Pimelobacter simplex]|nr:hypothetical protein NSI01_50210 [Pimelobacter simplex]SFM89737.1 PDDEXK-like protein of unknown function [Pimelobacter simplex]
MTTRPYRSGFCSPSNPPDSHARCAGVYSGRECSCMCHWEPEPANAEETPPGREPGFYPDIPEADYHADQTSLSHSGAKTLLKAPALFRHEQDNPAPFKKAWDYGTAAHAKVLGVGAEIRTIPPSSLAKNGAASTAEAKAFIEQARKEGAVPLKAAEVQQIDDMADQLAGHHLAMELLADGQPEVSAYAPDPETGILRRCRFDWLGPTVLTDYKSATSSEPAAFAKAAKDFGYYQQHPWYLDLARDLGHPAEAFAFIVQMKTAPYLVTVIELKEPAVRLGRERNQQALQIYRDCTEAGAWPGYVPDTEFARIDLPTYAYYDHEVETAA